MMMQGMGLLLLIYREDLRREFERVFTQSIVTSSCSSPLTVDRASLRFWLRSHLGFDDEDAVCGVESVLQIGFEPAGGCLLKQELEGVVSSTRCKATSGIQSSRRHLDIHAHHSSLIIAIRRERSRGESIMSIMSGKFVSKSRESKRCSTQNPPQINK